MNCYRGWSPTTSPLVAAVQGPLMRRSHSHMQPCCLTQSQTHSHLEPCKVSSLLAFLTSGLLPFYRVACCLLSSGLLPSIRWPDGLPVQCPAAFLPNGLLPSIQWPVAFLSSCMLPFYPVACDGVHSCAVVSCESRVAHGSQFVAKAWSVACGAEFACHLHALPSVTCTEMAL